MGLKDLYLTQHNSGHSGVNVGTLSKVKDHSLLLS